MSMQMLQQVMRMRQQGSISNFDAQRILKKTLGDKVYGKFVTQGEHHDDGPTRKEFNVKKFTNIMNAASSGDSGSLLANQLAEKAQATGRKAPKGPTGNIAPVSIQVKHLEKTVGEAPSHSYPYNTRPPDGFIERDPGRTTRVHTIDPVLDPSQTPRTGLSPRTFTYSNEGKRNPYDKSVDKKKKSKGAGKPKGLLLDDEQKKGLIY